MCRSNGTVVGEPLGTPGRPTSVGRPCRFDRGPPGVLRDSSLRRPPPSTVRCSMIDSLQRRSDHDLLRAIDAVVTEPRLSLALRRADDLRTCAAHAPRPAAVARCLAEVVREGDDVSSLAAIHAIGAVADPLADSVLTDLVLDGDEPYAAHAALVTRGATAAVERRRRARAARTRRRVPRDAGRAHPDRMGAQRLASPGRRGRGRAQHHGLVHASAARPPVRGDASGRVADAVRPTGARW